MPAEQTSVWEDHLSGGITYHRAGGIRTRALEAGSEGPAVIMLHGVGGHAEAYARNVVGLAERGFHTYSLDMLGHGYTDKPGVEYRISDYVGHVAAFIEDVVGGPAHVIGESLGGWVTLRLALARPELVNKAISVVGAGLRPVPPTEAELAGWALRRSRSNAALEDFTFERWRARLHWLVHDPASMPDEMVRIRMAIYSSDAMKQAAVAINTGMDAASWGGAQPELISRDELAALAVPVLYLWTDHNPTTPASVAQAAAEVTPGAQFALMNDCGHWPQYESPAEFNDIVAKFLNT